MGQLVLVNGVYIAENKLVSYVNRVRFDGLEGIELT
jgi:hypothetical protein